MATKTHLQKITDKAKQLRKANPKLKWIDAVKKASKLMPKKAVGAVKKKAAPKKAAKKVATKKHVDTKSHNVNIRVVSGVTEKINQLVAYDKLLQREKKCIAALEYWKEQKRNPKNEVNKKFADQFVKDHIKILANIKKQVAMQKKLI